MSIEKLISRLAAQVETNCVAAPALSLDGRIPVGDMFAPLSSAERFAADRIAARPHFMSKSEGNLALAFRPHGQMHLLPAAELHAQESA